MNFNSAVWMDGAMRLKHPRTTQISAANPPKTPFTLTENTHTHTNSICDNTVYFKHNMKFKTQNCHGNKQNKLAWTAQQ